MCVLLLFGYPMSLDDLIKRLEQKPVKLPQSSEHTRIAPNAVLRCALFAAIQSRDRRDMVDEVVYSQSGIKIWDLKACPSG